MRTWSAALAVAFTVATAFGAMPQCIVLEGKPDGDLKGKNTFVLYNLSEEPLSNRQWLGLHSIKLLVQ